eukprot:TRINITY_DN7177_c1_g1_i1.p1 TRINITY_DN7177_c1_g1~~TRINITY_DN7177_c1_g1_i1.p1  ORF type:complete len:1065 (+),score=311.07 TRINITY_DN7177_c1_g1_i1:439-3195(+)
MVQYLKLQKYMNASDWDFVMSFSDIMYASLATLKTEGLALTGFSSGGDVLLYYASVRGIDFVLFNNGTTPYTVQHILLPGKVIGPFFANATAITTAPGYKESSMGVLQPGDTKFCTIVPYRTFIGLVLVHYSIDVYGTPYFITYSMTLPKVSEYLRSIAQAEEQADMRLYTCTGPSWVDQLRAQKNITERLPWTQERLLTGTSHGNADVLSTTDNVYYPLSDVNATDEVISGIARGIDGNYAGLFLKGKLVDIRVSNSTDDNRLVLVRKLEMPLYGLDWWFVVSVSKVRVFGAMVNESDLIQEEIAEDRHHVEDEIHRNLVLTVGIILAVAVALTIGSIIVTKVILRPFTLLVQEMVWVSSMDLDMAESAELSAMREVREMQISFRKMKRNLHDYRAFVPTALLNSHNDVLVQEPPTGVVALVFTDIVKSTELWERSASGMNTALEMHNDIIREALRVNQGYEVKTIGDSFMVSFTTPLEAISFCLQVLSEMASQDWPADLLLENGMKLRIGCHVGFTIPEENPLTGRRDYRGPAVNLASRAEGKALPGTVCLTADVLNAVQGPNYGSLNNPKVEDIGMHTLKGIEGPQRMYLMAPRDLGQALSPSPMGSPRRVYEMDTMSINAPGSGGATSTNSVQGAMLPMAATAMPVKKTGLTLVKGQATVAVCMLVGRREVDVFDDCNAMVRAAVDSATQTDGVLGNVTGQTLTVFWNASKVCKLHTTSAMRFAAHLNVRASIMRVGIATGPLLYGNVGTQKRRFHTAFGSTLDAAHAAAGLCAHRHTFSILADLTPDCSASASAAVSPFLRMIDIWGEGHRNIQIYELLCAKLTKQLEDAWGTMSGSDPELEAHNAAFKAALKGDTDALDKLRLLTALGQGDHTMQRVVKSLEKLTKDPIRTCRVRVVFSSVPGGVLDEEEIL